MCVASVNMSPFCLLQQPCPGDTGPIHCQEVNVGKGREALVLIGVECVESGCRGDGVAVPEQKELCRVGGFCLEAKEAHGWPWWHRRPWQATLHRQELGSENMAGDEKLPFASGQ